MVQTPMRQTMMRHMRGTECKLKGIGSSSRWWGGTGTVIYAHSLPRPRTTMSTVPARMSHGQHSRARRAHPTRRRRRLAKHRRRARLRWCDARGPRSAIHSRCARRRQGDTPRGTGPWRWGHPRPPSWRRKAARARRRRCRDACTKPCGGPKASAGARRAEAAAAELRRALSPSWPCRAGRPLRVLRSPRRRLRVRCPPRETSDGGRARERLAGVARPHHCAAICHGRARRPHAWSWHNVLRHRAPCLNTSTHRGIHGKHWRGVIQVSFGRLMCTAQGAPACTSSTLPECCPSQASNLLARLNRFTNMFASLFRHNLTAGHNLGLETEVYCMF